MAVAISNVFQFPSTSRLSPNNNNNNLSPSFLRFTPCQDNKFLTSGSQRMIVCAASSAAGSPPSSDNDFNPYEVLGVNPIEGFDMVKVAYTRKKKDAERRGDEAAAARLEKAYDKLMMAQLSNRKKGVTYGSFQARPLLDRDTIDQLIDPRLRNCYSEDEVLCMLQAASLCIKRDPHLRPRMSQVLRILEGDLIMESSHMSSPRCEVSNQNDMRWSDHTQFHEFPLNKSLERLKGKLPLSSSQSFC